VSELLGPWGWLEGLHLRLRSLPSLKSKGKCTSRNLSRARVDDVQYANEISDTYLYILVWLPCV